jgi:hypothetical protein
MIKPLPKNRADLADVTDLQQDEVSVAGLFVIDREGKIEINEEGKFLLNPTTIEESKSVNWNLTQTPGQSDPILQWLSSGPRTISFKAIVTADTSDLIIDGLQEPNKSKGNSGLLNKVFSGTIASAFAKVADPPAPRVLIGTPTDFGSPLDISRRLNYYRSLAYPVYDNIKNPRRLRQSPPLLAFYSGSSVSKFPYGVGTEPRVSDQHDMWVLTNISIKITKQLPSLAPMEAEVDFQLTQYNVKSFDRRRFLE